MFPFLFNNDSVLKIKYICFCKKQRFFVLPEIDEKHQETLMNVKNSFKSSFFVSLYTNYQ